MDLLLQLDDRRQAALKKIARQRKMTPSRLIEQAVDEFIERVDDEELFESSIKKAKQTGLREEDAVKIVRTWRSKRAARRR